MVLITSFLLCGIFTIPIVLLLWYAWFLLSGKYYWKNRNVPYLEPMFLFGNTKEANVVKTTSQVVTEIYCQHKHQKILGIWLYVKPVLLVFDVTLIKNILVKDFQYFHDRGMNPPNEKTDPLSAHLLSLSGAKWRNLRVKLTPTFTSGKIKMMFPTMLDCCNQLQSYLEEPASRNEVIEVKEILARFTTDMISSCAFGIETNSLKYPDSEFRMYGKKMFNPNFRFLVIQKLAFVVPFLDKLFNFRKTPKEVEDFFMKVVRETIEYRETNHVKRKDFMDLLIQLRNKGYVEDADVKVNSQEKGDEFTIELATAQAFVFFLAGFETSSTTMTFALYELAKNPEVQKKLQKEIDDALSKNKEITYDVIHELEYLDCVINESLRMYPPLGFLVRACTKEYKIPDMDVILEKGTTVMIPVSAIHNDPNYYPYPNLFQPERFSPSEKSKRDNFLHLPFGEGPRNCIGNRFGLLQSKLGLFNIFSKYNIEVAEETPIPLKLNPKNFISSPINGMHLRITNRQ